MTINLHAADQQVYTVTVYADSNINIQTYADQSGYKTSFVTISLKQYRLRSNLCRDESPKMPEVEA